MYNILNCFSLIRNCNSVLNTNVGKRDLTYLHGIRVMSIFWLLAGHVFIPATTAQLTPIGKEFVKYLASNRPLCTKTSILVRNVARVLDEEQNPDI